MPDRINHVAVFVAAIVYFMFGYLWYGVLFGNTWAALMQRSTANMQAPVSQYVFSFVLGLIMSYAAAIALSRRPEDQTVAQGVSFALFMSIAIYATQTLNNALYAQQPIMLWLINAGYVVIGAIVGGWKKSATA